MEEITNLINQANESINNLENFIFESKKEKYINLKSVTDYMDGQIEAAEMVVETLQGEGLDEVKTKLNDIISKTNEIMDAFRSNNNIMVIVNENGEITTKEVSYENTQAPITTPMEEISTSSLESVAGEEVVNETIQAGQNETGAIDELHVIEDKSASMAPAFSAAFGTTPEITIIDDKAEEHQTFAPEVQSVPEITPQIPEVSVLDDMSDTNAQNATETTEVDYTKDLDVEAMDAFLGNQENTLKL